MEMKAAAYLLPNNVFIITMNKKDAGTWYSTNEISIFSQDVSSQELGQSIFNHLHKSKEENISYEQIRDYYKEFLKRAKFKSDKSFVQNARRVVIIMDNSKIILEPYRTEISQKIFYRLPESIVEIEPIHDQCQLGKEVRKCWEKCLITKK